MIDHSRTSSSGSGALRVILLMGVATFVLLGLTLLGLRPLLARDGGQRAAIESAQSPFDGTRAFALLEQICAIGPRPAGSAALEQTRKLILDELESVGLSTWTHAFNAETPVGEIGMVNLVGEIQGDREGIIIVSGHYETKLFDNFTFIGANDAGSSTAFLLELARAIGPKRNGRTLWLVFFDGEEAFGEWSDTNGLFGSRALAASLVTRGTMKNVDFLINVDMIGDCYLGVQRDAGAPPWMLTGVWAKARELGYEGYFLNEGSAIVDDHIPFRLAGVPAMVLIDFQYGGTVIDHERNWHTERDTIDKCCPGSLQVVGDVVYHALPALETHLDAGPRP